MLRLGLLDLAEPVPDDDDVCLSGEGPLPLLRPGNCILKGEAGESAGHDRDSDDCWDRNLRLTFWMGSAMMSRTAGRSVGRQAQTMPMQDSMLDHSTAGADLPILRC